MRRKRRVQASAEAEVLLDLYLALYERVIELEQRVESSSADPMRDPLRSRLLDLMHELNNYPVGSVERQRIHSQMSLVRRQIRNIEDSRRVG